MATHAASGPLRVLFLITDLGKGGAERFLLDLCRVLERRGDVELVIGSLLDDNRYPEQSAGLPVVQLDYEPFSFSRPSGYARYRALLDDFRPHVVSTHRYLAEFLSGHHVRDNVAYVCHCHDNMVQFARPGLGSLLDAEARANWLEKRWLIRHKYRRVRTRFVAHSTHTLEYFRSVLPAFMRGDVRRLPIGFDHGRFAAPAPPAPPGEGPLRIVNVGSFQAKKNQAFIVPIAQELARAGVDFTVDLLGDGALRPDVEDAAARSGLGDRIRFHGNVERVEEWLWKSHVYLHTAWYEPFGLVLLEAMAAGLPCVALDGKGNRDVVLDGKNGFLLAEPDAGAFAQRIRALASSPDLYRAVSTYARDFARGYDMPAAAEAFVDFYRRCTLER